jgi:prepilin-type N-terminal cleavage/methylation domain-containing protein
MAARESARAGFTLIESLVALAITSFIIFSAATLIHDGAFFFDRGTRAVDQTEQFALAVDCLTQDFGAARFVIENDAGRPKALFTGEGGEGKALFVTAGGKASGPQGEEIVEYSIEQDDETSKLVRRRAPWPGLRAPLVGAELRDPVILLSGKFDIAFGFSERTSAGALIWRDRWTGDVGLPHSVRLTLRDRATGVDLLAGGDFPVRANAPMACSSGKDDCLSLAKEGTAQASSPAAQQQAQTR